MAKCSFSDCSDIPLFHREYVCSNCHKIFCDDHICNHTYVQHLEGKVSPTIDRTINSKGYICINCLSKEEQMPANWMRSIINRKCGYAGCSKDLHNFHTVKSSCKICGLLFCDSHSHLPSKAEKSWLLKHQKYEKAESICTNCMPTDQHMNMLQQIPAMAVDTGKKKLQEASSELIEKLNTSGADTLEQLLARIRDEVQEYKNKLHLKNINYGVRSALSALSVLIIVLLSPDIKHISGENTFESAWRILMIGFSSVFLLKEFIFPAFKHDESKPYAILLIAMMLSFIAFKLLF